MSKKAFTAMGNMDRQESIIAEVLHDYSTSNLRKINGGY